MQKTILVIEDEKEIQTLITHVLQNQDYRVLCASNGVEGVSMAQEHAPDLIVCDIMMRYLDGYQVYQQLQSAEIVPLTPFIFLTALDGREDIRRGLVLGADDYIIKPFSPAELSKAVESVLRRRDILAGASTHPQNFDVFISYSHQDYPHLLKLREGLTAAGLSVWTDEMIEPSADWERVVAEAIKNAGCVVALLSNKAAQSEWVRRELGYAEANQTSIFPLLVEGKQQTAIPLRLITHQFIDARRNYEDGLGRLVAVIREHLRILPE